MANHPHEQFSQKLTYELGKQINDNLVKGLRLPVPINIFEEAFAKGTEKLSAHVAVKGTAPLVKKFLNMFTALPKSKPQNTPNKNPLLNYLDLREVAGLGSVLPVPPKIQEQPKMQRPPEQPSGIWSTNMLMW